MGGGHMEAIDDPGEPDDLAEGGWGGGSRHRPAAEAEGELVVEPRPA